MATKTKSPKTAKAKTEDEKLAKYISAQVLASPDLRRAEEFRVAMTELAATLDKASRMAASLLHSYPDQSDFYGHNTDLDAVRASAEVFAGMLRSAGAAD